MGRPKLEGGIKGRNVYLTEELDIWIYHEARKAEISTSEFIRRALYQHKNRKE